MPRGGSCSTTVASGPPQPRERERGAGLTRSACGMRCARRVRCARRAGARGIQPERLPPSARVPHLPASAIARAVRPPSRTTAPGAKALPAQDHGHVGGVALDALPYARRRPRIDLRLREHRPLTVESRPVGEVVHLALVHHDRNRRSGDNSPEHSAATIGDGDDRVGSPNGALFLRRPARRRECDQQEETAQPGMPPRA